MIRLESKATMRMRSTARIAASVLAIFIVVAAAGQGEMAFRHQSDIQKDSRAGLRSAAGEIERIVNASGVEPARRRFKELRGKEAAVFYLEEREMNALGYRLMQNRKMPEAIAVFEMNTVAFPQSWNAWDSLAEAHLRGGESDKAEGFESHLHPLKAV